MENSNKNTAEQAFEALVAKGWDLEDGNSATQLFQCGPRGQAADGWRKMRISLNANCRWLTLSCGPTTYCEIDHRDHWNKPEEIVARVYGRIEELAAAHMPQKGN